MLYIIGLGLNDEKDISVKGLELVKKCKEIYLEDYTSVLSCSVDDLEKFYGKKIIIANREMVELDFDKTILKNAKTSDVALLVVGDPMSATTHIDLMIRAKKMGVKFKVVFNASVLTAVGLCGLQLYKFGKVSSIPFDNKNVEGPYDNLKMNLKNKMHSLFLLDLAPSSKKFLSIADSIRFLQRVEIKKGGGLLNDSSMVIGISKLGSLDQKIKYGKVKDLLKEEFKQFPQCLIVPSELHFMEAEALEMWR